MFGDKPYGLRDIKLTNMEGTVQVDLPAALTMTVNERVKSAELEGDDTTLAVVTHTNGVDWDLEVGGLPIEAWALITGRTISETGTTPNQVKTLKGSGAESFPYFKIYGKVLGEGADDVHMKVYKAKCTKPPQGSFKNGAFFNTATSGVGIDDGVNGVFDLVQNETADDLPTT